MDENRELQRQGVVFVVCAVISFFWLAAIATIFFSAKPCADCGTWLDTHYYCRSPNEIGDFLAGGFAPLAFFWLVAAVLIQSKELKAQQEVLEATRKELVATREVANQQAKAAQEQATLAGEQISMLKDESLAKAFEASINNVGFRLRTNRQFANLKIGNKRRVPIKTKGNEKRLEDWYDRLVHWCGQ